MPARRHDYGAGAKVTKSMMAIEIRDADEADIDLLVSLNQVVQDLHCAYRPS